MDARARTALAVGGGYLLGRTKKLKLALSLAGMMAGKRLGGSSGTLGKSVDILRASPEFDRLRKQIGGVGRNAAMSAATSSLGRVTDRLELGRGGGRSNRQDDESDGPRAPRGAPCRAQRAATPPWWRRPTQERGTREPAAPKLRRQRDAQWLGARWHLA
jgi:hypothetical protein